MIALNKLKVKSNPRWSIDLFSEAKEPYFGKMGTRDARANGKMTCL